MTITIRLTDVHACILLSLKSIDVNKKYLIALVIVQSILFAFGIMAALFCYYLCKIPYPKFEIIMQY